MEDPRIRKFAQFLIRSAVELKKGEKILIELHGSETGLMKALVQEAYAVGGKPFIHIFDYGVEGALVQGADAEHMEEIASYELERMKDMDAYIDIRATPNISAWHNVSDEAQRRYRQYYWGPIHLAQRCNHTKWSVLRYPNDAMAQLAGVSTEEYEDFYFRACLVDYDKMGRAMRHLEKLMDRTDRVHIIAWCSGNMPRFNTISISGYHMGEAGANCVQQVAFTLADGIEYIKAAISAGLKIDDFAPRLSFFFGIGMDLFMNVAMLRAARYLWSEAVSGFGAQDPKSLALRTHCQTSGWSLTEQDPYNNVIRTTIEALAATLGGTQSLHTNAFDEALGLPTDFSARIARNTQIIIQEESELCRTVDPLAGSYYVESLTDQIVKQARAIIQQIDEAGGMAKAIEAGLPKRMIEEASAREQSLIDQGKRVIVGVNKYKLDHEDETDVLEIDNVMVRNEQIASLERIRATRDDAAVTAALNALTHAAQHNENLLAAAVNAARVRATLGEISDALEAAFDRYLVPSQCVTGVIAQSYHQSEKSATEFDAIVAQTEQFLADNGRRPRILIAKMGQDGHDRGAKVIASAYSDLGFDVDLSPMFSTPEEIARLAVENDVHVVGASSLAAGHKTLIPELVEALKKWGREDICVVAGGVIPPQDYAFLQERGVAAIYGPGTPMLDSVRDVLNLISQHHD